MSKNSLETLLQAVAPFAKLHTPEHAPDDAYDLFGPCRITFGQVRRLAEILQELQNSDCEKEA